MKRSAQEDPNEFEQGLKVGSHSLVLLNDNVNSYDYVIESLVEVCNHNAIQAEQCTLIAHHNGKCEVRTGGFDMLKTMKDELARRGLSSLIYSC